MATRILVVGDTHVRQYDEVHPALRERIAAADIAIHCGDWVGMAAVEGFREAARQAVVVHGNSDAVEVRRELPYREVLEVEGARLGVTHPAWGGPEFPAPQLRGDFPEDEFGAIDVICFGHFHVPLDETHEGVRYVNGGQGYPSFLVPGTVAWIEIEAGTDRPRIDVTIEEFAPAE
jgi:putative phosphoesterase